MTDSLFAIIGLGVLAGGAIVLIDSLILRRIRRQDPRRPPVQPQTSDEDSVQREDDRA